MSKRQSCNPRIIELLEELLARLIAGPVSSHSASLLMETGDYLLLETGDYILLEA